MEPWCRPSATQVYTIRFLYGSKNGAKNLSNSDVHWYPVDVPFVCVLTKLHVKSMLKKGVLCTFDILSTSPLSQPSGFPAK